MTTKMIKYNLKDFETILFNGFNFNIPEDTLNLISKLSMEVGSPTYIKTPNFQKKENAGSFGASFSSNNQTPLKKKRSGKNSEIGNENWETVRSYHVTTIEHNIGIDAEMDKIRSCINKISDKNYSEMLSQIIYILNNVVENNASQEEMTRIGTIIFEIASNNKFYSKLYADIYTELIKLYPVMEEVFKNNYSSYMELFDNIECGDPDKDYNKFCLINKQNEKRKAISTFFVNLSINGIIDSIEIVQILHKLLGIVLNYMKMENKKNEVDELTENIAILYNKNIIALYESIHNTSINTSNVLLIDDKTIPDTIRLLASTKVKTYASLSSKTIFKFMDM
jgi:hypothetical protein